MQTRLHMQEVRLDMAIRSVFDPGTGTLTIFGDNLDNQVVISRNAAGEILVNGGAVPIEGGTPTVANTALIQAFGLGGNDNITLDETNGALPRANLFGGEGNDTLTGGSGSDQLFGQGGEDILLGKGGVDFLFGGNNNDILTGGDARRPSVGEGGDDRTIWNPGDDTRPERRWRGQRHVGDERRQRRRSLHRHRERFARAADRLYPARIRHRIGTTENVVVNMYGGKDRFERDRKSCRAEFR